MNSDDNYDILIEGSGKPFFGMCRVLLYFEQITKRRFLSIITQIGNNRGDLYRDYKIMNIRLDIITSRFCRLVFDSVDEMFSSLNKLYLAYFGETSEERKRYKKLLSDNNMLEFAYSYDQIDNLKRSLENNDKIIGINFEFVLDKRGEQYRQVKGQITQDLADPNLPYAKLINGEEFLIESEADQDKNFYKNINDHYQGLLEDSSHRPINNNSDVDELNESTDHYIDRVRAYGVRNSYISKYLDDTKALIQKARNVFY